MALLRTRERRWRRAILPGLAGLAGFGLCGVVILLLPPVQRSVLLALLDSPGLSRLEVGTVRIRPGSFRIEGLVAEKEGVRMEADIARGTGPFWKAVFGAPVRITQYRVEGWRLRLDAALPPNGPLLDLPLEAALVFLPFGLTLEESRIEGRVELIGPAERAIRLDLEIEGRGLGPGRTGRIVIAGRVMPGGVDRMSYPISGDVEVSRETATQPVGIRVRGGLGEDDGMAAVSLTIGGEAAVLKVDGLIEADLPALDALFLTDGLPRLTSGSARLSFALSRNTHRESLVDGQVELSNLVLAGSGYRVDRIAAPLRLVLMPEASLSLRAPLEVVRGGRVSDLLLVVSAVADAGVWKFEGSISGQQILIDDLALLAPAFRMPADALVVDAAPAWRGLRGRFGIGFERVGVGAMGVLEDLEATLLFEDTAFRIEEAAARLAGGSLSGGLTLAFDAEEAVPYRLTSRWVGSRIEAGQLVSRGRGGPVIEGPFAMELTVEAPGENLRVLGDRATGDLALLGGPGRFRGFQEEARAAATLAGFFGNLLGSDRLQVLAGVADELGELDYDQIRLNLLREATGGLLVERIQLQGPGVKLAGQGRIGQAGIPDYGEAPMELNFRMGAKGTLADLLGQVGLTEMGRIDAEGYRLMSQRFTIRGTPARPDASDLWNLVRQAASSSIPGGGR